MTFLQRVVYMLSKDYHSDAPSGSSRDPYEDLPPDQRRAVKQSDAVSDIW